MKFQKIIVMVLSVVMVAFVVLDMVVAMITVMG